MGQFTCEDEGQNEGQEGESDQLLESPLHHMVCVQGWLHAGLSGSPLQAVDRGRVLSLPGLSKLLPVLHVHVLTASTGTQ